MSTAYWTDLAVCGAAVAVIWGYILRHDFKRRRKPMARRRWRDAEPWKDPRCSIRKFREIVDTTKERQAR